MTDPGRSDRRAWLDEHGLVAWRAMRLVREFETRLPEYAKRGLIPGSSHPAVGMEAVAVGVSLALEPGDTIASTHRGHAHCLARGADPGRLLAEIFGRSGGYCHGKGGSMHVAVRELGILGTNAIVGGSIGIATGAALAAALSGHGGLAVSYFGDGAVNQGIFHESLNLAAIWKLPCLYVCENNHFAQSSRPEEMTAVADLSSRAAAYGIPGISVDGMDIAAVFTVAATAIARARAGAGPTLLVADTYRFLGHMIGDTEIYRTRTEVEDSKRRDPLTRLAADLAAEGLATDADLERVEKEVALEIDRAEAFAIQSPPAGPAEATSDVYGRR